MYQQYSYDHELPYYHEQNKMGYALVEIYLAMN